MSGILIIGYGNPLRSDDGFGWVAARRLEETLCRENIEIIACHQLMPEMAEPLSRVSLAIFLDSAAGRAPGEMACELICAHTDAPPTSFSHGFDCQDLLFAAQTLYGQAPPAYMISVGGASFEMGAELSPPVRDVLPRVLWLVHKLAALETGLEEGDIAFPEE